MEVNIIHNCDNLELMPQLVDNSIDVILTDPPYGLTQNIWDKKISFEVIWKEFKRLLKPNGIIIIFACEPFASYLRLSNQEWYKYDIVWYKKTCSGFLNAKKQPLRCHELISVFYKKQPTYNPQFTTRKHLRDFSNVEMKPHSSNFGKQRNYKSSITPDSPAYPRSVVEITGVVGNSHEKTKHPTQKPIRLMEYLIQTYSNVGDIVLDPFSGSGSTAIACINSSRKYICCEINKEYYDISINRINTLKL